MVIQCGCSKDPAALKKLDKVDIKYYANGNKMSETPLKCITFSPGSISYVPHSTNMFWRRDGSKLKAESYVDGSIEGLYREWHPDGSMKVVANLESCAVRKRWKEYNKGSSAESVGK